MKIIVTILVVLVLILSGLTGVLLYSNWKMGQKYADLEQQNISKPKQFNSGEGEKESEKLIYSDKKTLPEMAQGEIISVDSDSLILKQYADVDLEYQLKKTDLAKIILVKKNPDFNEDKANKILQEMQNKMANQNMNVILNPVVTDPSKITQNKDTSKTTQEEITWNQIQKGSEASLTTDSDGNKILTISSEELRTGNPLK